MPRQLTQEAQDRISNFERSECGQRGCSCFISPPCGHCTDPDNPINVMEEDGAWEPASEEKAS